MTLQNFASGGPVQGSSDITAATTVYYSPYVGNQIPIWNGSSFSILPFAELSLNLSTSAQAASGIYDACVFNNSGVPTLVFGPAWSNATPGSGSRGTGAGSAQIAKQNGIWVNSFSIAANNGSNTYTVPALQCTYVGSVSVDSTPGQVSAYRTWGQNRKFGVWNAYNRVPITLLVGDGTNSWNYNTATVRPSNNNPANSGLAFTGLPEEQVTTVFSQFIAISISSGGGTLVQSTIAVCDNSSTAVVGNQGFIGQILSGSLNGNAQTVTAHFTAQPTLGLNKMTACESGNPASGGATTFNGTFSTMQMSVSWRG